MSENTARKLDALKVNTQQRQYEVISGNRRKKRLAIIRSGMFLGLMFSILALVIVYYLMLQSDITNATKSIASKESRLNELRLDNDENYSRITSDVNLEEVRRIAIQELGMKYADEGQIISFNGEGSDYVRQTGEIPE